MSAIELEGRTNWKGGRKTKELKERKGRVVMVELELVH